MRKVASALIAALLVGCSEDTRSPAQPQDDVGGSPDLAQSGQAVTAAAADGQPIRGFAIMSGGVSIPIGSSFTTIQKLSLPAGKYIATASAVIASQGQTPDFVGCLFFAGARLQGDLAKATIGGPGSGSFVSLPVTAGFTLGAPATLRLECETTPTGVGLMDSQTSHITAIRVDSLTIQQGS